VIVTEPVHIFLHIPKTAGVTIHEIAARQYPQDTAYVVGADHGIFHAFTQEQRDGLCYVGGHFSHGFHRHFTRPCRYVTMLRDPADLLVSCYHYIIRCPNNPDHGPMVDGGVTFPMWLAQEWLGHIDNHQLRCLLGKWPPEPVTWADIELGKRLLAEEFAAFGLVERFDESMLFFQDAFGWGVPTYTKRNVYRCDRDGDVLTPEAREIIADRHAMSCELVAFARRLFDQRARAAGNEFTERLRRLQEANQEQGTPARGAV